METPVRTLIPSNPYEGLEALTNLDAVIDSAAAGGEKKWTPLDSTHMGGTPIQYVSEVLRGPDAQKPAINHDKITGDLEQVSSLVWSKIVNATLTVTEATAFLWRAGKEFKGTTTEKWTSYDIPIVAAEKGGLVTVQTLLRSIESTNEVLPVDNATVRGTNSLPFLVGLLLAPYRTIPGMRPEYLGTINERIWGQIQGSIPVSFPQAQTDAFNLSTWTDRCKDWSRDKNYGIIVAAYDMFWSKFKDDETSKLRVCTIRSRYLDCAVFMGWQYLRNTTAMGFLELATWIWDPMIAANFRQVFQSGEELGQEDSYLPYLASMKISKKSPYSASVNPYLHMFIHSVGCLKNTPRSVNARMVGEINVDIPLKNAIFLWLAKTKPGQWAREITYAGDDSQSLAFIEVDGKGSSKSKKGRSVPLPPKPEARYWHRFIQANQNDLPPYMWDLAGRALANIVAPRSQTIGDHAKKWGMSQLTGEFLLGSRQE